MEKQTLPESSPKRSASTPDTECLERLHESYQDLRNQIGRVIVGQEQAIELLLIALLGGGHCLLVGLPGLAKTLLVKTLSRLLSLTFRRIQFTPDLMPSDITGTDVLEEDPESGRRTFRFLEGPVFANMLLADEINRTPPKTQAALLEAMQESSVTVGRRTLQLPRPFFVVATQNPIEQEGTYPLPEAQLDRFSLSIEISYPEEEDELEIMKRAATPDPDLEEVLSAEAIEETQRLIPRVPTAEHVYRFALRLVRLTRPDDRMAPDYVKDYVSYGAGPRAAQGLILAAKARAALRGRSHVSTSDVRAVAVPVLAHRILANFQAAADGMTSQRIVEKIVHDIHGDEPKNA
ncbi:MAG: AAA family ATPase [Planctomycetota bacterium]